MLQGVDTSHWNGALNFQTLAAQGKTFCIAKATEGLNYIDNQFARSRIQAPKAGLIFGSYHFFHPKYSIESQVNYFEQEIGPPRKGELVPALDWETTDSVGLSVGQLKLRALTFMGLIEKIVGAPPLLYFSPGFVEALGDMSAFERYGAWIAHYGVARPRVPVPWKSGGYTIWQYTDQNGLDLDVFNGNMDQLKKFTT